MSIVLDLNQKVSPSFRQKALRGTFGTNDPFEDTVIRGLDLRMGNTCNLKCIMCNSYSLSATL